MLKNSENNGTEEIGLVTPTPGLKYYTDTREGGLMTGGFPLQGPITWKVLPWHGVIMYIIV